MRRRPVKSGVKYFGSTGELPSILAGLRKVGVAGTASGAVKCVDIGRNAGGEDARLDLF